MSQSNEQPNGQPKIYSWYGTRYRGRERLNFTCGAASLEAAREKGREVIEEAVESEPLKAKLIEQLEEDEPSVSEVEDFHALSLGWA